MLKLALNVWITHGSSHEGFSNRSLESRGGEDVSVSVNTNREDVSSSNTEQLMSVQRHLKMERFGVKHMIPKNKAREHHFIQRGFSSSSACSTLLLLSGVGGGGRYSRHREARKEEEIKRERQGE